MNAVNQGILRSERKALGVCVKCGRARDSSWFNCSRCREAYRKSSAKKRGAMVGLPRPPRKPVAHWPPHCECGRGRKVRITGHGGIHACRQCHEADGGTEAQFAVLQAIRASESPPSVYALAMECETSVDAVAHVVSRMVRTGVLGKRTLVTFGGSKDLGNGETAEYYEARRGR